VTDTSLSIPPTNDLLLRALRGEPVERPPVWMMRQAGRYLPEYRAVRAKSDFLTMCRTPELAVEVTLQPLDLVGVDAAIIFSDILVVPEAMGMHLTLDEGIGPQFTSPIRTAADLERLRLVEPEDSLKYMLDGIRLARREINGRVPLIGFAGAPWTLAAYMIEGKGTKQFALAKRMLFEQPIIATALLDKLATAVGDFLLAQIAAGAQTVQVFESWAGSLGPEEFRRYSLPYLARIAARVRATGVPLIVFAPGAGWALREIADATQADAVGVDWHTSPHAARTMCKGLTVAMQGNLDPCALYAPPAEIRRRTHAMISAFGPIGHVANLGHGILPDVSPAHARAFVDAVKEWRWTDDAIATSTAASLANPHAHAHAPLAGV
jgi:uroporphyrinogen decarboxylase